MADTDDWGLAAPPFDATRALEGLRRSMRSARLAERSSGFDLQGRRVVELAASDQGIAAKLAKKPLLTPEWDRYTIKSQQELRRFEDEVRRRLARWQDED